MIQTHKRMGNGDFVELSSMAMREAEQEIMRQKSGLSLNATKPHHVVSAVACDHLASIIMNEERAILHARQDIAILQAEIRNHEANIQETKSALERNIRDVRAIEEQDGIAILTGDWEALIRD